MQEAFHRLDPTRIKPFAKQPRKRFHGIPALAEAIKAVGQVTPIVVRKIEENGYVAELVDGERRLKACLSIGKEVKAVYEDDDEPGSQFARSVAANFCRQEHDCIEISEAILTLKTEGHTNEQIAAIFGKSIGWVIQYASLAGLAPSIREELQDMAGDPAKKRQKGQMTLSLALALVPLQPAAQVKVAAHIAWRQLGIAAARLYIQKLAADKPKGVVKEGSRLGRQPHPGENWQRLASAVAIFHSALDRYVGMPHAEFTKVIECGGAASGPILADQLDKLCEDALGVADAIRAKYNK